MRRRGAQVGPYFTQRRKGRPRADHTAHATMADLSRFLIIDASSGAVLPASACFLVADDALPDDAWQAMADDGWSDADAAAAARQYGRRLPDVVTLRPILPGESPAV